MGTLTTRALFMHWRHPPLDEQTWCPMDTALLDEYNRFYGLQFNGVERHLALIESTGERITLQAFVTKHTVKFEHGP